MTTLLNVCGTLIAVGLTLAGVSVCARVVRWCWKRRWRP